MTFFIVVGTVLLIVILWQVNFAIMDLETRLDKVEDLLNGKRK